MGNILNPYESNILEETQVIFPYNMTADVN